MILRIALLTLLSGLALAQTPKPKSGWVPPSVIELKKGFDSSTDNAALQALVLKMFGKQNLAMGKAGAKVEATTAAWAVISPSQAHVIDGKGKVLGEMRKLNDDGLQVLAMELPNFTEFDYKVEAEGMAMLAGTIRVEHYEWPPESKPQPDVPQGRQEKFEWKDSKVFPNTARDVTVYVPAQYDATKPTSLMVWQDGSRHADPNGGLRATRVFDTLIAKGEMPVTIGVFIDPGRKLTQKPGDKAANRGFEYDSLGDAYSRFVIDEILPEVKRRYSLTWSDKPEDHAIGGGSSGGICAFTVAWEHPDQFRKVLSWVGSFVDLRGGHVYPAMIRKTERKPLRIYLLDGDNDLDNPYGNWPIANQNMAAALKYMGYDYRFDFGHCFHGSKGMSASLPDALRWLWRKERAN
jgi:enterochelin esterase family protein